jgi:hypothetical protein
MSTALRKASAAALRVPCWIGLDQGRSPGLDGLVADLMNLDDGWQLPYVTIQSIQDVCQHLVPRQKATESIAPVVAKMYQKKALSICKVLEAGPTASP